MIPVVVLTTSQSKNDIFRAYEHNANAYVNKPLDYDQFITVIKSIANVWLEVVKLPMR